VVKWSYASVDLATNSTTVNAATSLVWGVIVTTALSAHVCEIKDGSTVVLAIPASAAIGDTFTFDAVIFATSLVVDPDDAATGRITVIYKASV